MKKVFVCGGESGRLQGDNRLRAMRRPSPDKGRDLRGPVDRKDGRSERTEPYMSVLEGIGFIRRPIRRHAWPYWLAFDKCGAETTFIIKAVRRFRFQSPTPHHGLNRLVSRQAGTI